MKKEINSLDAKQYLQESFETKTLENKDALLTKISREYSTNQIFKELVIRAELDRKTNGYVKKMSFDTNTRNHKLETYSTEILWLVFQEKKESLETNKLIYGNDDRKDIYMLSEDPRYGKVLEKRIKNSKGVLVMVSKDQIIDNGDGSFSFRTLQTFSDRAGLCDDEKFLNQISIGSCTAFAVGSYKIISAGHCIDETNWQDYAFVFDFLQNSSFLQNNRFPNSLLYLATKKTKSIVQSTGTDFSIITVNKKIDNDRIVSLDEQSNLSASDNFYVIGCPYGLPLKQTDGAKLRTTPNSYYFSLNCDTYQGNSGSPVFLERNDKVVGVLVRVDTDFVKIKIKNCLRSIKRPNNGGRGEDVTSIKTVADLLRKF